MKSRNVAILLCALGFTTLAGAEDRPLMCFGTEPFWSLDLTQPGDARFSTPDGESVLYRGAAVSHPVLGETLWRGSHAEQGDVVAWLQNAECSDNMSDVRHPVTSRVSLPDGRFLAGCCRVVETAAEQAAPRTPEGGVWRLTLIGGAAPAGLSDLPRPVSVEFSDGRIRGFSGCNNLFGGYRIADERIQLGQLGGTMMACPGPAMEIERAFLAAFSGSPRFELDGDRLLLSGGESASLEFALEPPPQLAGSNWKVTAFNNNREAVVGVMGEGELTLSFGAEEVSGSAGCNRFWAGYSVDGETISFEPIASTRRFCGEDLMQQEQEFLAALASAVRWEIDGNVLDMHRADGQRAVWAVSQ